MLTDLLQHQTTLQWITESTPDFITVIDLDYKILYVNRVVEGLKKDDIIGYPLFKLVKPDDQERVKKIFDLVVKTNKMISYETFYELPNGEKQYFESIAKPLFKDDLLVGLSISSRDITEKRIQQKKIKELLESKNNELTYFAKNMNHDLRNYFDVILKYLELYEMDKNDEHINQAKLLLKKTEEILYHSIKLADLGLVIDHKTEISLPNIISQLTKTFSKVDIIVRENIPNLLGDHNKVLQIFKNLIENALVHGDATIVEIGFKYVKDYDNLTFYVLNNGKSIPPEISEKIFTKGFSIKNIERNSGLGLYITKKIVNSHGWTISLADTEHVTFEIKVPLSDILF